MKHLKYVEHTLTTCINPATHHECLLIAATACPLPRAIPLLLSVEGAVRHRGSLASPRAPCTGAAVRSCEPRARPCRHGDKGRRWGGAHSPESRVLAGRGGATAISRRGCGAEGPREAPPWSPVSSAWTRREQVLSMRDRRHSSPHGGAPPAVRLPWVKTLSTGSSVHVLQHREMGGVKKSGGNGVAERRCRRMDKDGASEAIARATASISVNSIEVKTAQVKVETPFVIHKAGVYLVTLSRAKCGAH
jgi:hypothetical protein